MLFGGVSLDDRLVRELALVLERPLGRKLEQALLFRAKIVALTRDERAAVLAAGERAPAQLDEVRKALLADENWRAGRRQLEERSGKLCGHPLRRVNRSGRGTDGPFAD